MKLLRIKFPSLLCALCDPERCGTLAFLRRRLREGARSHAYGWRVHRGRKRQVKRGARRQIDGALQAWPLLRVDRVGLPSVRACCCALEADSARACAFSRRCSGAPIHPCEYPNARKFSPHGLAPRLVLQNLAMRAAIGVVLLSTDKIERAPLIRRRPWGALAVPCRFGRCDLQAMPRVEPPGLRTTRC